MFTGIVQGIAEIIAIEKRKSFRTHTIRLSKKLLQGLEIGASVSNNGCCLSVTHIKENLVTFTLIKETLYITNLHELQVGDLVNIERSAKFGDEIGGHILSGHIITTAEIYKIIQSKNNHQIWFRLKNLTQMKFILYKGFIGIDGISLTINKMNKNFFCVNLIPETIKRTTLGIKKIGENVNIEIDLYTSTIVKTVEHILARH